MITELGEQGSTTGTDLQGMNGNLAGRFVLGADVDATATAQWNNGQGFQPIFARVGRTVTPFSGTFDGLGHAVSNLTTNRASTNNGGLFGQSTGHIRHVGLTGGSVTGASSTGALVGQQTGGSIGHVYSTANVSGTDTIVGGLIGRLQGEGSVRHARSSGTVSSSSGSTVGGLIGGVSGASTVTHSHASGSVSAPNATAVGGLVGSVSGSSTLSDVSATGQVTGLNFTGGLIGTIENSTLSRAFASGAVNGPAVATGNSFSYGGLVGVANNPTISDVFAIGAVNAGASGNVGGLIGSMFAGGSLTNGYITDCP